MSLPEPVDYGERHSLPGMKIIRVIRFCVCDRFPEGFLVKVRRGVYAPFLISCPCGHTQEVRLSR